jgi:hypothetical protein
MALVGRLKERAYAMKNKESLIFHEKRRAFCGSVKVLLDKLRHEELPEGSRQCDEENVARLVDNFHRNECYREPSISYRSLALKVSRHCLEACN